MFWACCSMTPQLMAGGLRPSPRKLSDVSLMMIAGRARVVAAIMWLMKDGTMCLNIMRSWLAPAISAAVTKSSSLSDRNRPLTSRAKVVQPISEMIIVIAKYTLIMDQSLGTAAAIPIHSGIVGIDRRISMTRWITVSIHPP